MKRVFFSIILISFCLTGIGALAQDSKVSLSSKGILSFGEKVVIQIYNIIVKGPWNAIKWIFSKVWQFTKFIGNLIKGVFVKKVKNEESGIKEEFIKETNEIIDFFPKTGKSIIERTKQLIK